MKFAAFPILAIICMAGFLCSCSQPREPVEPSQNVIEVGEAGEILPATLALQGGMLEMRASGLAWDPDVQNVGLNVFLVNKTPEFMSTFGLCRLLPAISTVCAGQLTDQVHSDGDSVA